MRGWRPIVRSVRLDGREEQPAVGHHRLGDQHRVVLAEPLVEAEGEQVGARARLQRTDQREHRPVSLQLQCRGLRLGLDEAES